MTRKKQPAKEVTKSEIQECPPHVRLYLNKDLGYECEKCGVLLMFTPAKLFFAPKTPPPQTENKT